jgi:HlyD family secretion protein
VIPPPEPSLKPGTPIQEEKTTKRKKKQTVPIRNKD